MDDDFVEIGGLPELLTIRQAAKQLVICPGYAYALARLYERTGCEGLPAIRVDDLYCVPRSALVVLAYTGRIVTADELAEHRPPGTAVCPNPQAQPPASRWRAAGRVGLSCGCGNHLWEGSRARRTRRRQATQRPRRPRC